MYDLRINKKKINLYVWIMHIIKILEFNLAWVLIVYYKQLLYSKVREDFI